jgi:hypothetical protein
MPLFQHLLQIPRSRPGRGTNSPYLLFAPLLLRRPFSKSASSIDPSPSLLPSPVVYCHPSRSIDIYLRLLPYTEKFIFVDSRNGSLQKSKCCSSPSFTSRLLPPPFRAPPSRSGCPSALLAKKLVLFFCVAPAHLAPAAGLSGGSPRRPRGTLQVKASKRLKDRQAHPTCREHHSWRLHKERV